MRNDPRHIFTRRVLIEVGQGVVIGIEPVRCDIGSITAGENGKVDHHEWLLAFEREEIRGSSVLFVGPKAFYTLNAHWTQRRS